MMRHEVERPFICAHMNLQYGRRHQITSKLVHSVRLSICKETSILYNIGIHY